MPYWQYFSPKTSAQNEMRIKSTFHIGISLLIFNIFWGGGIKEGHNLIKIKSFGPLQMI